MAVSTAERWRRFREADAELFAQAGLPLAVTEDLATFRHWLEHGYDPDDHTGATIEALTPEQRAALRALVATGVEAGVTTASDVASLASTERSLPAAPTTELRLPGWVGPTFFTPEAAPTLRALLGPLAGHPLARAAVVGTIRETLGAPVAHAAYCVHPAGGALWLVDVDAPHRARFVNRGVDAFARCTGEFVDAWTRAQAVDDAGLAAIVRDLRSALGELDAEALADADGFWSEWVEALREGP